MKKSIKILGVLISVIGANNAFADGACNGLPSYSQLKSALSNAVLADTSGFQLNMWATVVNRDGVVCAVAYSGANRGSQWPGSRVISAQKANTANAFSLDGLALSTGNLYSAVQGTDPDAKNGLGLGGSLYGLQFSNPVDPAIAYGGNPAKMGTADDPMVGGRIGGVNVFGGGLALYNSNHKVIGGLGLSGDSSCADHDKAWRTRHNLSLDFVPATDVISGDSTHPDNIVYDEVNGNINGHTDGWEQPSCGLNTGDPKNLPATR